MSGLIKGLSGVINKAQANSAAMGLDAQRRARENTLNQSLQQLKEQRENVFAQIGKQFYATHRDDLIVDEEYAEMIKIIAENDKDAAELERQIEEIKQKYEEEVRLLKGEGKSEAAKCPKCGSEYKPGVNLFCSECGEDLRKAAEPQQKPAEPQKMACPNCGQTITNINARFCKSCGGKLKEGE